ncbi:hypothetical protein LCGC14_0690070 [marine sediment metagenome]|uniref:Uncharacterized protein n=1 Tax=marine sediment metagenome TaxID=412755 RepID=A0A0F9TTL3_9ZZZZ|nr:hypothetical protein [Candidatus Aminicenantes bacterium]
MNVRETAQSAIGDTVGVDPLFAQKWVSDRIVELSTATLAKPLRRLLELTIPATVTAGTMTATQGSKTVTGDATAQAAWSNLLVGRYLKADSKNGWFEIAGFANNQITLRSNWFDDTVTASSYTIAPRTIAFPKNIRAIGAMRNLKHNTPISRIMLDDLDLAEPGRTQRDGGPLIFSEVGINDNEERVIEFYPYTSEDVLVAYTGYLKLEKFEGHQEVPNFIDSYMIIEGVKMNIYEHKMSQSLEAGNADVGATWGNMASRQRTIWRNARTDFIANNESVEDAKFILESYGSTRGEFRGDVRTARDHILLTWTSLT